jgi:hypothetical protein
MTECYHCGKPIYANEPSCLWNVAPDAASGGTMMPFHSACAPMKFVSVPNTDRPAPKKKD